MARKQTFNNKNQLSKILQDVDTIQGKAIIDTQNKTINAQFSATMTGDYMANDGFTPKQLEQLGLLIKPINERLTSIENWLDNVEQRLTNVEERLTNVENRLTKIENCPTIQKEIKED